MKRLPVLHLIGVTAAVLALPWLAGRLASWATPRLGAPDAVEPWAWASLHHLFQLALTVGVMLALGGGLGRFGFNLRRPGLTAAYCGRFFLWFLPILAAVHAALALLAAPPDFGGLTPGRVAAELGFKALLSGTCEEPLFRGLVMTVLYRSMRGTLRLGIVTIPHAGLIATALFMLAHVQFSLWPPAVTFFSPVQQAQALGLGLFYAVMFHRTRSLVGPIIVHNGFNASLTAAGMAWAAWAG